jgi:hypothetical protein
LNNNNNNKLLDPAAIPGIPLDLESSRVSAGGNSGIKKRGKEGVKRALQLAQHSTASMGRCVFYSFFIYFF